MELNITLIELALFTWAAVATGFAMMYKENDRMARAVILHILDNKDARDKMVAAHEQFMKERRS
jgi:hypothetical protein